VNWEGTDWKWRWSVLGCWCKVGLNVVKSAYDYSCHSLLLAFEQGVLVLGCVGLDRYDRVRVGRKPFGIKVVDCSRWTRNVDSRCLESTANPDGAWLWDGSYLWRLTITYVPSVLVVEQSNARPSQ
jgi:hypothetical protein